MHSRRFGVILALFALTAALASPAGAQVSGDPQCDPPAVQTESEFDPDALLIPVVGVNKESLKDSFKSPRYRHKHHAIDIMAPRGTPVVAVVDGAIASISESDAGGLTIYLVNQQRDTVYYYAHLDHYAPDIEDGMEVRQGEVLGYVGSTGNAKRRSPHLHFAVAHLKSPRAYWGGVPTNPYTILMSHGKTFAIGGAGKASETAAAR
ncbi:MAG TPA: M23 family metallopeptidase [Thermoanaerobaculia bacterium]|nr:M23 family metallopeptidase [Thermoanaerobaculia bacterium]